MLISTKIHPPQLKSNLLNRKHLTDRLSTGKNCRLILITAPAGYGKTSLAGQWINCDSLRVAWYSIDHTDNDFDVFFRYFLAALVEAESGLEKFLGPLLQGQARLTEDDVVPTVIHALNTLADDLYVILDDFHLIGSDTIHKALARLMKYLPPKIHIVIISRYMLPRLLSRIKCQYDMVEVPADNLKFSADEARDFFETVIPLDMTKDQIQALTDIADGWVTGFQIFGLSQTARKLPIDPESITKAAGREVMDYLITEVVMVQPESVKQFLYQTSALTRLNADICRYITGFSDAGKILDDLHRMNLFLVTLEPENKWYRYHDLFAEAVRTWVSIANPDFHTRTKKKAAIWCWENNYLEEAFQYALASGDDEFAAELFEDYLALYMDGYKGGSAYRWMLKLPSTVFLKRPLLRLFECSYKMSRMKVNDVFAVLPEIEESLNQGAGQYDEDKKIFCNDMLVYLKTAKYFYKNMFNADVQKISSGIEKISEKNIFLVVYLKIYIVSIYLIRGEVPSAEKHIKEALHYCNLTRRISGRMFCMILFYWIFRIQGRLKRAEEILLEAENFLEERNLSDTPLKLLLHLFMAWIYYERNELDKALDYGEPALMYVERDGDVDFIFFGYELLSNIWMAKGDLKKAMENAQKSKSLSESIEYPQKDDATERLFFFLSIKLGKTDVIKSRVDLGKPDASEPFSSVFFFQSMTVAISLFYQGKLSEASLLLEVLRKRCEKRNIMEFVLKTDIFLSGVYSLMGKKEQALRIMKQAVLFSEKEGYVRPFVDYAALIFPLLKELEENSKSLGDSDHFKSILKACEVEKEVVPITYNVPSAQKEYDLTEREMDILRFMSNGYRNKQIADKAFISLATVKTHINHIYKKLDVNNRFEAVNKVRALIFP